MREGSLYSNFNHNTEITMLSKLDPTIFKCPSNYKRLPLNLLPYSNKTVTGHIFLVVAFKVEYKMVWGSQNDVISTYINIYFKIRQLSVISSSEYILSINQILPMIMTLSSVCLIYAVNNTTTMPNQLRLSMFKYKKLVATATRINHHREIVKWRENLSTLQKHSRYR